MARERRYAVTWHKMTNAADAGDVLMQVPVVLDPRETALSLKGKCHDAALTSFPLLLERMLRDDWARQGQNPSRRRFLPRDSKADHAALLDWTRGADEHCALVRALAFVPYVNRLGVSKLWLGDAWATVRKTTAPRCRLAGSHCAAPGQWPCRLCCTTRRKMRSAALGGPLSR